MTTLLMDDIPRRRGPTLGLVVEHDARAWVDWIYFSLRSVDPVDEERAQSEQARAGYLSMGYGFDSFRCVWDDLHKQWVATWRCSNSCE